MKLYLLDMGAKIYGDCIVITNGDRRILIDGAHPGDWKSSSSTPSIPDQLKSILGSSPFHFDLLVVTHCHLDHIGCLPKLVSDGTVTFDSALVADEKLGFPAAAQDGIRDTDAAKVVAAMTEEPQPELKGAALDQFLADAVTLAQRYSEMLAALKASGTKIVRYTGPNSKVTQIEQEFSDFNLQVLGPTNAHLKACRDALVGFQDSVRDTVDKLRATDAALDAPSVYQTLAGSRLPSDAAIADDLRSFLDRAGPGAARNDQSMVIKLGEGEEAVLLTGDMQLAKSEIAGLDDAMETLLQKLKDAGPYAFVKLPHHASYNGFDQNVLEAFKDTPAFGISTGRGDPKHPDRGVLDLLDNVSDQHTWARTDRNGLIAISFAGGKVKMKLSQGEANDTSANTPDDSRVILPTKLPLSPSIASRSTQQVIRANNAEHVEVITRIPHTATRVTVTIEIEPRTVEGDDVNAPPKPQPPPKKNGKRLSLSLKDLPQLLFITDEARLAANIGQSEADEILAALTDSGQKVIAAPTAPTEAIQRAASGFRDLRGVVILGGYDVVPAERYDTLPPSLRASLRAGGGDDPDNFIVWSDQIYGDLDGDQMADVPVSRIPDGRSAQLIRRALSTAPVQLSSQRFGLRNVARPFADKIYKKMMGPEQMLVSHPTRSQAIQSNAVNASLIYFMLHGSDADPSRFWGEVSGGMLEAMYVGNVPNPCGGVVFAGCCWGALTVRTPAHSYRAGDPVQSLTPEQSIALSFLAKGARAFVGCTGAHYSPLSGKLDYFGAPMHDSFWSQLASGKKPAEALFAAKIEYIAGMPHGRETVEEVAIENKILRQFTCLGLGW
jgi:beta-lactamase superfamily II metal-dependent hydrolase